MEIEKTIRDYKRKQNALNKLLSDMYDYYIPIIRKLKEDKNKEALELLLDEIPDSSLSMYVYSALRDLRLRG